VTFSATPYGSTRRFQRAAAALAVATVATVAIPAAAGAANQPERVWVPASTMEITETIRCPGDGQHYCVEKSGLSVSGHYAPKNAGNPFLASIAGNVLAGYCPSGLHSWGAADWIDYLELRNFVGGVLVHAEVDGQTAWNGSTACTAAVTNHSWTGWTWMVRKVSGPGSFWSYTNNANVTWENVCAGGPFGQNWTAYLRQDTTAAGRLSGGNFSNGNGC